MKKRNRNHKKQHDRVLIGSIFSWVAVDPLAEGHEITETRLSHVNPMTKILLNEKRDWFHGIINRRRLKWHCDITVHFVDPNGKEYTKGAEMVIHGVLKDADGAYQGVIEKVFQKANMRHYVKTQITMQILENDVIKDHDFSDQTQGAL